MKMRLNKYISQCGIASRRKADELIESGRISVNGKVITSLGFQIDEDKDVVKFDGEKIKAEKFVYYLLNKPKGVVTTTLDEKNRKTVIDLNLHPKSNKNFCVGLSLTEEKADLSL